MDGTARIAIVIALAPFLVAKPAHTRALKDRAVKSTTISLNM